MTRPWGRHGKTRDAEEGGGKRCLPVRVTKEGKMGMVQETIALGGGGRERGRGHRRNGGRGTWFWVLVLVVPWRDGKQMPSDPHFAEAGSD